MMIIMGIVGVIFAIVVIGKIPDVVNRACLVVICFREFEMIDAMIIIDFSSMDSFESQSRYTGCINW